MSDSCKNLNPEIKDHTKQGIISILGLSREDQSHKILKTEPSLRRTLSADMSSNKFLSLHSSYSIKKVASSEEISSIFPLSKPNEEEEDDQTRATQTDIWNFIQAQKPAATAGSPYVHPLVRRSSSSLSTKSLELCTESLGSETGSDCTTLEKSPPPWFSSSPPSPSSIFSFSLSSYSSSEETSERDFMSHIKEAKKERLIPHETISVNYNCTTSRKSPARSFPPPLPSISRIDGPCLHVKPHRQNGRLVLQAVKVPSHSYLHAQREGGRLRLSFASTSQRLKNQNDDESLEVTSLRPAESQVDAEENIIDDDVEKMDVESEGDTNEISSDDESEVDTDEILSDGGNVKDINDEIFEVQGVRKEDQKSRLKVLEVLDGTVNSAAKVVSIERWGRSTCPAVVELHRLIGKIISQPFMNMNPWTTGSQKKVAVVECGGGNEKERGRFNVYKCLWRGGEGGFGEGKVVGSAVLSQELVKEASGLAPTRCSDPRRTHHLLILERYCVATT